MSLPSQLADDVLRRIRDRWTLRETPGAGGGPYLPLVRSVDGESIGALRIWSGPPLEKLVYIALVVPQMKLDSHMLFAFSPARSAVPHFTLDSVAAGDSFAFHLDLVPRVDLAADLAYLDAVMEPLTEHFVSAARLDGLRAAPLLPRQRAQMSPWMLAYRADETAFAQIGPTVTGYLEHWLGLFDRALPAELDGAALGTRDRRNRSAIFNASVDPVWSLVERIIGADTGARLRHILIHPEVDA